MKIVIVSLALLAAVILAPHSAAQCGPQWLLGSGMPGAPPGPNLLPMSASTLWDPDGPGPEEPWLVVGGDFGFVGTLENTGIARWNPVTGEWASIGGGFPGGEGFVPGDVRALAVLPNNDLVAGGAFYFAGPGGVQVRNIARWDGTAWRPLGTGATNGVDATVLCLTVLPNGDLIAGGGFSQAGGVAVQRIARWNGSSWSAMGAGMTGGSAPLVFALDVLPNGDLLASGRFSQAGTVAANSIARWNGTSWSGFAQGLRISTVEATVPALLALPDGSFVVGGDFTSAGTLSVNRVARWTGSAWTALGSGITNPSSAGGVPVRKFVRLPSGDIIAGGAYDTAGGITVNNIARWNGTDWSSLSGGVVTGVWSEPVRTMTLLPDSRLFVGGSLVQAGAVPVLSMALWDGSAWSALTPGTDLPIQGLLALPDGGMVACGAFTTIGGVTARGVARWDGRHWSPLGQGVAPNPGAAPTFGAAVAAARAANGDLYVGGYFDFAGGISAHGLAKWNGTAWSAVGGNVGSGNSGVSAIAIAPNGDVFVGGLFSLAGGVAVSNIARWDGNAWSPLGAGVNSSVRALAFMPNGDLIAGGSFSIAGGQPARNVARWNGVQWSALGTGMTTNFSYSTAVNALLVLPAGDLIAAGQFENAGGVYTPAIARWNGSSWTALGSGFLIGSMSAIVDSLALHTSGDIVAAGNMRASFRGLARWNGTTWSPFGSSLGIASSDLPSAYAATVLTSGEVVCGGAFFGAGTRLSAEMARWTDTGIPWVALQPIPRTIPAGQPLALTSAPADGYAALGQISFQWRHNDSDIPGASGPLDASGIANLTIASPHPSDAGAYAVVFSNPCGSVASVSVDIVIQACGSADFNCDGDTGTDQDIDAFFACLSGLCPSPPCPNSADFNADGDVGTDQDIESFFRVLGGGTC